MSGTARISTGAFYPRTREQRMYAPEFHDTIAVLAHSFPRQSVILVHRPPISLPPTTVAPPLLNELIGEISSLASIYQKPAATFIGLGRIGVKSMQHKGAEQVVSRI